MQKKKKWQIKYYNFELVNVRTEFRTPKATF